MRKAWFAGVGVAAAVAAAVFVGAAAATTGAPVFYDARYPAPASSGPGGYEAGDAAPDPGAAPDALGGVAPGEAPVPPTGTTPPDRTPGTAPATPAPAPTPTPTPAPDADDPGSDRPDEVPDTAVPPTQAEREAWLAFQQVIRDCMADAAQEYLYWEWWNPGPDTSNRFPAMPADLTRAQVAVWEAALQRCSDEAGAMRRGAQPPPADGIGMAPTP